MKFQINNSKENFTSTLLEQNKEHHKKIFNSRYSKTKIIYTTRSLKKLTIHWPTFVFPYTNNSK